jgi:hypothetical protein
MRTWLRSVVDTMLGRVPGKISRPDTATRMAMDADFSYRREPPPPGPRRLRERGELHLAEPPGPLGDVDFLEELVLIVNEAQERDAQDERRLYDPMLRDRPSFSERPRSTRR